MANEKLQALMDYIAAAQVSAVVKQEIALGEWAVTVKPDFLRSFITFLKNDPQCEFQQLVDVCGADYPDRPARFDVIYNLLSLKLNQRVRVKVALKENEPVDTVTGIFSAAGWFEREAWDLYGILFTGNPDLRRILTDYGFEGHPLRKDFPLTGFVELHYDEKQKRVVYAPVHLTQDYRNFDFISPWEGMTTVQLPGDEKARKQKVGAK
ncbi:MAG: NADH-quinone oxidoreductase subunit C [Alphaproteobacteria bacterium]|nr:NADH-quinone oxidoreductase subunit C [Alphaproteobacteria bacterium]